MLQNESYKTNKATYALTATILTLGGGVAATAPSTLYQPISSTGNPEASVAQGPFTQAKATEGVMSYDERLIDAKLEAVEARTETKFAQLMGELKLIATNVATLGGQMSDIRSDIASVKTEVGAVKTATASVKWNLVALGLTMGGLFIAIAAFGTQILDLAQGLFSAGVSAK